MNATLPITRFHDIKIPQTSKGILINSVGGDLEISNFEYIEFLFTGMQSTCSINLHKSCDEEEREVVLPALCIISS